MAHVTAVVSDKQVEYRIAEGHGCGPPGHEHQHEHEQDPDKALDYRVAGMGGEQVWVGRGLADVGLTAGSAWQGGGQSVDADAARKLMAGVHPVTGEELVAPVVRLPAAAKLPGAELVAYLAGRGLTGRAATGGAIGVKQWETLTGQSTKLGDAYQVDVRLLGKVAGRAGVDLADVYGQDRVDAARHAADTQRVDVRTRGYDLTLTLPKSFSVAWALAPAEERARIAETYLQAATETVATAEQWHARATRGHHGDGKKAEVVETTGLIGWISVDPVNRNGDAHWHAHVTLAAVGKGKEDGQWSALSSAGQDSLFGSVQALGGLMEARARTLTAERLGWEFRESPVTGRLEVAHVPDAAIRATSTRRADVVREMEAAGLDPGKVTAGEDRRAAQRARKSKTDGAERTPALVARTQEQVAAAGVDLTLPRVLGYVEDPDGDGKHAQFRTVAVADAALGELRPLEAGRRAADKLEPGSWAAQVADARALLADRDDGPSAHASTFTHRQALGLVAAAVPAVRDEAHAELLLVAAVATRDIVRLQEQEGRTARYTTREVVDAERKVLTAARDSHAGFPSGAGVPVVTDAHLDRAAARFRQEKGYAPNPEQLAAVRFITQGGGRFDLLSGLPGTGKTTVMKLVNDAYREAGVRVEGAATAAIAAQGLAADAGFRSRTIASTLLRDKLTAPVLVIDEAGMTDTRDVAQLLRLADKHQVKVIAIGDARQLPSVGVGGWFEKAHQVAGGPELVDVFRQREEHELTALRAYRGGQETEALQGYAAAGQVIVTNTREEALAAAAAVYATKTAGMTDPLQRVTDVALLAGRREDVEVLNTLARVTARESGQITGPDVQYDLWQGGRMHLAVGDAVVLRSNSETADGTRLTNGQRAVVTGIDRHRQVTLAWTDPAKNRFATTLSPADVAAGQVAVSYLETDRVQGAAATTVHLAQGRTVEHAIAVLDPGAHAATYVALSRDRQSTTPILSVEALTDVPEERARLMALPPAERDAEVITGYGQQLRAAGAAEEQARQMVLERYPELAGSLLPDTKAPGRAAQPRAARTRELVGATDDARGIGGAAIFERDRTTAQDLPEAAADRWRAETPAADQARPDTRDAAQGAVDRDDDRGRADDGPSDRYSFGQDDPGDFEGELQVLLADSRPGITADLEADRWREESAAAQFDRDPFGEQNPAGGGFAEPSDTGSRAGDSLPPAPLPEGGYAEVAADLKAPDRRWPETVDVLTGQAPDPGAATEPAGDRPGQPAHMRESTGQDLVQGAATGPAAGVGGAPDTGQADPQGQRAGGAVGEDASAGDGRVAASAADAGLTAVADPAGPTAGPVPVPQEGTDGAAPAPADGAATTDPAGPRPPARLSLLERTRALTASIKQGAAATEQLVQDAAQAAAQSEPARDRGRDHQQPAPAEQQGPGGLDR